MKTIRFVYVLLVLCSSACFTTRFTFRDMPQSATGETAGVTVANDADERWHHDGITGLVEFSKPVKLDSLCPQGVAYVEQETSFLNGLVERLTFDWYNPQTVTVYCVNGAHGEAALNAAGDAVVYMPLQDDQRR